jgi:glycerol kinase
MSVNHSTSKPVIVALDQGTTSSRAIAFDEHFVPIASEQREFTQHFPQSGWVEHDADEIWSSQLAVLQSVMKSVQNNGHSIKALGITNQRETTVVWSRKTGRPIWRSIVWQDRRTEPWCKQQRDAGLSEYVHKRTGLVLDPYFSASKLVWLLEHVAGARKAAESGELAFGTVDTWIIWNLTGGRVHATDETNAARTMLYNIERHEWDDTLLARWHIPKSVMPEVRASAGDFGSALESVLGINVPIRGVAGDQQAALFGQGCIEAGEIKNTYGTGCFMLMNTGAEMVSSKHGLITTAAASTTASFKDSRAEIRAIATANGRYAIEGSVFVAGAAVQWLRDGLGIIKESNEIETLARTVNNTDDVFLVPAFTGLGSPYWDANARGVLVGLNRGTTKGHIARACLESIAFQSAELALAMQEDSASKIKGLRVDGGAAANNLLMQMQADLLDAPVVRPKVLESTARGAAALAFLGANPDLKTSEVVQVFAAKNQIEREFVPTMSRDQAGAKLARWREAVKRSLNWGQV